MDELLEGFLSTGLAGIAVQGSDIYYEKYRNGDEKIFTQHGP